MSSPFRARAPVPLFFENGQGSHLWDVDGNEYIDYQLAWGPMILGYNHPAMVETSSPPGREAFELWSAARTGNHASRSTSSPLVPCAERIAFTSSGSEAVQLVHRLARAHTGRPCILKFEGHYHGWMDGALHSYKPQPHETGSAGVSGCGAGLARAGAECQRERGGGSLEPSGGSRKYPPSLTAQGLRPS